LLDRVRNHMLIDGTSRQLMFQDDRLDELVFRYRARNFSEHLSEDEAERWAMTRVAKLVDGEGGARTLASFFSSLDALKAKHGDQDPRLSRLLAELGAWGAAITP
jgi:exodeoxyribonuclease I